MKVVIGPLAAAQQTSMCKNCRIGSICPIIPGYISVLPEPKTMVVLVVVPGPGWEIFVAHRSNGEWLLGPVPCRDD